MVHVNLGLRAARSTPGCHISGFQPAGACRSAASRYLAGSLFIRIGLEPVARPAQDFITMKALYILPLALILSLCSLVAADKPPVPKGVKSVGVEEFDKLRGNKDAVVLDVRTEKEFNEARIPGAVNLDVNGPDFEKKLTALDKNKTYLVHCAGGRRSLKACAVMKDGSFKNLVNLEDGFGSWTKAGKPVEKK